MAEVPGAVVAPGIQVALLPGLAARTVLSNPPTDRDDRQYEQREDKDTEHDAEGGVAAQEESAHSHLARRLERLSQRAVMVAA